MPSCRWHKNLCKARQRQTVWTMGSANARFRLSWLLLVRQLAHWLQFQLATGDCTELRPWSNLSPLNWLRPPRPIDLPCLWTINPEPKLAVQLQMHLRVCKFKPSHSGAGDACTDRCGQEKSGAVLDMQFTDGGWGEWLSWVHLGYAGYFFTQWWANRLSSYRWKPCASNARLLQKHTLICHSAQYFLSVVPES